MEIIYGTITTKKIHHKAWEAVTEVTKPFKSTVRMIGNDEKDAVAKLKKFFDLTDDEKKALDSAISIADDKFKS
jgi:hypothetical protein